MSRAGREAYLWQVLEAQADDLFALYQLAQLLADATDVDELVHLALPELARVSDSTHAALFLPAPDGRLQLAEWIAPDPEEPPAYARMLFPDAGDALHWFCRACGLERQDCIALPLDLNRPIDGLILLAAPSRGAFDRHGQYLLGTMSREIARMLQPALDRVELRRRQEQTEQMQADFVAAVSHELRTPLALIRAGIDTLQHLSLTPDQQQQSMQDISSAAAQLTRIVDTILDFSRLEDGQGERRIRRVDLADVVARAADECDRTARQRLQIQVPSIAIRADTERLTQAIGNLVSNALKYSPTGSLVRLRARAWPAAGIAWLEVRDWGRGIPPDDQAQIFSKFFRASDVRESSLSGIGLGLYITKRLVEGQGGAIRLRSRPGWGTAVRVCLPLEEGIWRSSES
jgi:signal transduction histidine kinase